MGAEGCLTVILIFISEMLPLPAAFLDDIPHRLVLSDLRKASKPLPPAVASMET